MKTLCLVDNSSHHAYGYHIANDYAIKKNKKFRGLLNENKKDPGIYHVGPMDMDTKKIISLAKYFNTVIFLNQPQEKFSHDKIFLNMWKLIKDLRKNGVDVLEENKNVMQYLYDWENIFEKNRNICVLPFVELHNHGIDGLNLCGRSMAYPVVEDEEFSNDIEKWSKGKKINKIRKNMLENKTNAVCKSCHKYEEKNIRDQRWDYSFNWIAKLRLKDPSDLKKIKHPIHYNLRLSNKCNLMCKMCSSNYSHLIEKEYSQIKDQKLKTFLTEEKHVYNAVFDHIDINKSQSVYITGGEPSFNPVTARFLQKCIDNGKTDLEINIQTNAAKITPKFFSLTGKFTNMCINVSVDGVGKINEYQRWLVNSKQQSENILLFRNQGHHIHIIHVVSIYNIATIGNTMKYFDENFPFATVQLQWANFSGDILSPFSHPNRFLVMKSLQMAKDTKCYWHNESGATAIIDHLYDFYSERENKIDLQKLRKFFWYNDNLDQMRGSKLKDYIPDLEECRKYIK